MVTDIMSVGEVRFTAPGSPPHLWLALCPLAAVACVSLTRGCVGPRVSKKWVIQDTTAFAKFHVTYTCIVFRPFKGEVLDCIVTSVNKVSSPPKAASTLFLGAVRGGGHPVREGGVWGQRHA